METASYLNYIYLADIIKNNYNIKQKNIEVINSFKTLYDITSKYYDVSEAYDTIISNFDSRVEFLMKAVEIAITSKTMDNNTKNIVFQMYATLYNYLTSESQLKEIIIPNDVKEKIDKKNFMPSSEQLIFLMTLINQNKKIFDEEFDGKDLSQTFTDGLHKNITEVLSIKKNNLPHILGLTSKKSHLFAFYRKTMLNRKYNGIDIEKSYDLINLEYKDPSKNQLTEEEILLNKSYDEMPKSKLLDFYSDPDNVIELLKENTKVCNFTYEYIKNNMFIKQYNNKGTRKNILDNFTKEEISLIENTNTNDEKVRELLDKYIENKDLSEIVDFQDKFKKKFGYEYPLIEYNKLLSKNIGFYNFSLFENLNSVIVDYSSSKKIKSDLILVSYSQSEMNKQEKEAQKILEEEKSKLEEETLNSKRDIDKEYFQLLKSLTAFPPEERYYFRQMRNDKDVIEEKYNNEVLQRNMKKKENISLIGFRTSDEEKERIKSFENNGLLPFEHHHICETMQVTNYFDYKTDWTKNGIEYPIQTIIEQQSGKVLKLNKYIYDLKNSIKIFNEYKYNKSNNIEYSINYEKYLIKKILTQLDNYECLKKIFISLKESKKINVNTYDLDNEKDVLNRIRVYNLEVKNYFDNYLDILDKKLSDDNIINIKENDNDNVINKRR